MSVFSPNQLTLRGSGRAKAAGVALKAICRRCTSPLAGSAQSLLHSFFESIGECLERSGDSGCDRCWG
jgi:hypothetical protein